MRDAAAAAAPSLRVQTVLYGNPATATRRSLTSLARACQQAKQDGILGTVSLYVGDSSSLPALNATERAELEATLVDHGIDSFQYDFFDANLGSAGGHNRLLTLFEQDLLLVLNPDVVADPFLINELFLPLDEPLVGVVEARQLPLEHPKPYDHGTGETPWVTTACALVRRTVLDQVGGFDAESFFLYCDDVDWSWRARLAGHRLVLQPSARVFHDKRIDERGHLVIGDAMIYYSAEAALFMFHKYSRRDLVDHYLRVFEAGAEERPLEAQAAREYRARVAAGRVPEPLDPEGRVATFVNGQYAAHRF